MTSLERTLRRVARLVGAGRLRAALVGGMAVSVRSEPRFTRDVDLAVAVASDAEAEGVVEQFTGAGYQVESIVEQSAAARLATVRLRRSGLAEEPFVDLLFGSSGIEPEIVEAAEPLEVLPAVVIPVARAEHLLATKVLAADEHRPQDRADALVLASTLDPGGVDRAREAIALIEARGFARDRDLQAMLDDLLSG